MEQTDESSETLFNSHRRRSFFPPSSIKLSWWQKIRTAKIKTTTSSSSSSFWAKSVSALVKIRELATELVAGERIKTFIRSRFNKKSNNNGNHVNIQYDAMSYAKNFDDGPGQNRQSNEEEEEDGYYYASRNFSSRYAKTSMDMDKDGTTFA